MLQIAEKEYVKLIGSLKAEFMILLSGRKVAAIPEDVIANSILCFLLTYICEEDLHKECFTCPSKCIQEAQATFTKGIEIENDIECHMLVFKQLWLVFAKGSRALTS